MLHLSACYTWLGCAIFYLPYIQSFRQSLLLIDILLFTISFSDVNCPQFICLGLLLSNNIQFPFPMLHSMSLHHDSTLCSHFPTIWVLNCLFLLLIIFNSYSFSHSHSCLLYYMLISHYISPSLLFTLTGS